MGKAIRWLKGLFGMKLRDMDNEGKEKKDETAVSRSGRGVPAAAAASALCNNPTTIPPNITPAEAAWLSSFFSDKDHSQHAIAVAAATAAAADAAAAAAHAAAAVVRLTSHGGGALFFREKWAAVKIQAVFRGYLGRKALRCLKGLVRIQALVRGYLVRKQATATFHSMQALMRAQASVRAQKFRASSLFNPQTSCPHFQLRKSIQESSDEAARSWRHPSPINGNDDNPKIVEIDSVSSPLWCRIPGRSSTTDSRNFQDSDLGMAGEECRFTTAQSTPVTPAKSVCVESSPYFNFPNYMANTKAFRAKLRSQSAPKQRPEPKKRASPSQIMESRASVSGGRMTFKNAIIGKLDRSLEFS